MPRHGDSLDVERAKRVAVNLLPRLEKERHGDSCPECLDIEALAEEVGAHVIYIDKIEDLPKEETK